MMRATCRTTVFALTLTASGLVGVTATANAQIIAPQPVSPPATTLGDSAAGTSLASLFAETIEDFRKLPSGQTATILSIGGVAATLGHRADNHVTTRMSGSEELGELFSAGDTLGSAQVQFAGALATYTLGRITGHSRTTQVGADLFKAQLMAQIMTQGIKFAVGRPRPDGTTLSFPSGHTSTAFATATVLQRDLGWKAGIPAYAAASYIAASRVQAKRHYLSDVAFGAAVGIVAGRTVTIGRGDARFALAPAAHAGGAGINLTWLGKN